MIRCLVLFVLLACLLFETKQTELSLPISETLFCKLSLSMKRLEQALLTFQTPHENKFTLWKRTKLTKKYLNELNYEMNKYNNVILGSGNKASGNKNVIVGNYNNIEGSKNWVFISKFTGKINGDLLISEWRVEIDKADQILEDARYAISFLDQSKNKPIEKKTEYKHNRQICKWNDWAKPTNKGHYNLWNKYFGYDKYANRYNRHHTSWLSSIINKYKERKASRRSRNLKRDEDSSSSRKMHHRRQFPSCSSSSSSSSRRSKRSRRSYW